MARSSWMLLGVLALLPLAAAQEEEDCCTLDGRFSGFVFGVIGFNVLLISLNGWLKAKKPNWYSPGTSSYCRRMLLNEVLDLLLVLMIFFAAGATDNEDGSSKVDDGDEDAYAAFGACNSLVLVFLIVYWSKPIQKQNIFLGSAQDRGKRVSLNNQVRHARTTITGRKLISERLRAEVEGFNQRLKDKYRNARTMALQVAFFKIFDVIMLGYQIANLCESTACSFWKQLGTIFLIATFYVSSEDVYRLRTGKPELIVLAKEEGRGKANIGKASMTRIEAYNLVRDLMSEILDVGKFCAYYIATDNEFRNVSVQIYDWEQNPHKDPRIDACMWCSAFSMAIANAMSNDRHVSVTALHLANSAMKNIRDQLLLTTPDRTTLLRNVAVLYQTSFHSLPEDDREWLDENMRTWAKEAQELDDPKQYTVLFLGLILPEDIDSPENQEQALEALIDFYDGQHRDLLSGRPLLIIDDATLEWINIAWENLSSKLDNREELGQLQAYIDTIMIQQSPSALREGAILIDEFRRRMKDNTALPMDLLLGGLVSKFEELVEKEAERAQAAEDAGEDGGPRRLKAKPNEGGSNAPRNQDEWNQQFLAMTGGDKNGTLNRQQFRKIYTAFNVKPTPIELSKYFSDNKLDYDEFQEFLRNHNLGGWRDVVPEATNSTIVPSVSVDPVPVELIRVHGAKGTDVLAPITVAAINDRLDEDLDIRSFAPEGTKSLLVSIDSPLRVQGNQSGSMKRKKEDHAPDPVGRKGKTASKNLKGRKKVGSRLKVPSIKEFKEFVLDWLLYAVCAGVYMWTFINSAQHMGDDDPKDMDEKTFLGLPPYYDFVTEENKHHRYLVPLVYADMHCALFTFALIPLTMSRWIIRLFSRYAWLAKLFRIEHAYWWHKRCGYNLAWLLLIGALIWWIATMYSCTENNVLCFSFFPEGEYFDFYDNGAAVIFLRELVVTSVLAMLITSGFIFSQSIPFGKKGYSFKVFYAYELFYYVHIMGAYTIALLAFTSRWDVFYPALAAWGIYFFDVSVMFLFNTHPTKVHGATCFSSGGRAVQLKLKKPPAFKYRAGQTVFLKVPALSWLEWHPFSIASAPDDEYVEFLIDCSHGDMQWTDRLFKACEGRGTTYEMTSYTAPGAVQKQGAGGLTVLVYGPNGSAFQAFEQSKGVMLVGGGSGLPSSLSGLRHMFNVKRMGGSLKAKVVAFVWSTRTIESLLWCWDHLKLLIERQVGYEKKTKWSAEHEAALAKLTEWLDISINVTQMSTQHLNRLVEIEKNSNVGSWLVHRLNSGRITAWVDIFQRFHSSVNSRNIKVFFCGPGRMAKSMRMAAKEVAGFHVEVSSENFHDN